MHTEPTRPKPAPARLTSPEERAALHAAYAEGRRRGDEIGYPCPDDSIIQYAVRAYDEAKYGTRALTLPDWLVDLIHAAATAAEEMACTPDDQHAEGCDRCAWAALYQAVPQHTKTLTEQGRALRIVDDRRKLRHIEALIEASSLGTPEAKALRESVPVEVARKVVARSKEIGAINDAVRDALTRVRDKILAYPPLDGSSTRDEIAELSVDEVADEMGIVLTRQEGQLP